MESRQVCGLDSEDGCSYKHFNKAQTHEVDALINL